MGFANTNAVIKYYANNYLNMTVMFENYYIFVNKK